MDNKNVYKNLSKTMYYVRTFCEKKFCLQKHGEPGAALLAYIRKF